MFTSGHKLLMAISCFLPYKIPTDFTTTYCLQHSKKYSVQRLVIQKKECLQYCYNKFTTTEKTYI